MPEYLAPGVYVEETSFRSNSIEGVSTSTTGFAGPTRRGPVGQTPELLTSYADFEQIYGGFDDLSLGGTTSPNYIAHAVRAYFEEGGSRLYVARAFANVTTTNSSGQTVVDPGTAHVAVDSATPANVSFVSLTAGVIGNGTVTVAMATTPVTFANLSKAPPGSVVRVYTPGTPASGSAPATAATVSYSLASAMTTAPSSANARLDLVTVNVTTTEAGVSPITVTYAGLGLTPTHPQWIGTVLGTTPTSRADQLTRLFAIQFANPSSPTSGTALLAALIPASSTAPSSASAPLPSATYTLAGGNDGQQPGDTAYDYDPAPGDATPRGALTCLQGIEDIAIIAAPGSQTFSAAADIQNKLILYAEKPRAYRVAVLDTPPGQLVSGARDARAVIDSEYAALYYPWVVVANPVPGGAAELALPPSGFLCGIYARTDDARGVFKAPANEVVQSALRFERDVNFAEQEVLNPLGVNCLRFFPGRGYRVWGARTVSSNPEWKYISVRRYFVYLEHSIDVGTQWAVFEPNGDKLWANIRQTISSFLYNEWVNGALLGTDPTQAFFVRCDRTTMTQNDLDNGRLVCLIGVAVVKPAEFVIFRIGQMTADARS